MSTQIQISTDKARLDVELLRNFLSGTYWAKGRSQAEVINCIEHSLNFGAFINTEQVGYARVVTDYTIFAYILDVFVVEHHQKKGYATQLMQAIMEHSSLQSIKVWRLSTSDSHGLYSKFGFVPLKEPENMMEKLV